MKSDQRVHGNGSSDTATQPNPGLEAFQGRTGKNGSRSARGEALSRPGAVHRSRALAPEAQLMTNHQSLPNVARSATPKSAPPAAENIFSRETDGSQLSPPSSIPHVTSSLSSASHFVSALSFSAQFDCFCPVVRTSGRPCVFSILFRTFS